MRGSGSLPSSVPAGEARPEPFGTTLVTLTMSGSQIRELLKQQWCGRTAPNILQPSANVRYAWSRATVAHVLGVPCADAPDPILDLQINGAAGHDLTTEPEALWSVGAALPRYGVAAMEKSGRPPA